MDENLIKVKINENPIINLEITTYKNEADVNFLQSKGEKGDKGEQGIQGPKGDDGITPDASIFVNKTTTINNKDLNSNISLTTSDISEGTNLYYTDARVNANSNVAANTSARHTHNNINLLNNLTASGDGTQYLANDGTYKTVSGGGGNLGYTAENVANKATSIMEAPPVDHTQYPSALAVVNLCNDMYDTFETACNALDAAKTNKSIYYNNLSAYTLTNGTAAQSIFGKTVILGENTLYRFRAVYHIGTGATSHTTSHGFYVTSALASCNYIARTVSAALNTTSTNINTVFVTGTTAKVLNAASTAVTTIIQLEGTIRTNQSTLLQPQITFSAAPGATCQTYADSFIEFVQIGTSSDTGFGTWD